MLAAFALLLSSLLILITLGQILTVNLVIRDELYIRLDFLFINLLIYPFKNSRSAFEKRKAKRDKKLNIGKKFNKGKKQLLLLREILKRSDVDVIDISLPKSESSPAEYVIKSQSFAAFVSVLVAALKFGSRSFKCTHFDFFDGGNSSINVDISFKMSLLDVAASLLSSKFKQRKVY